MSVIENVARGDRTRRVVVAAGRCRGAPVERQARAEAALEAVGLADRRHTRALDLAYAERKFLSVARLLASGARLWLLDEPASGLDPRSY